MIDFFLSQTWLTWQLLALINYGLILMFLGIKWAFTNAVPEKYEESMVYFSLFFLIGVGGFLIIPLIPNTPYFDLLKP